MIRVPIMVIGHMVLVSKYEIYMKNQCALRSRHFHAHWIRVMKFWVYEVCVRRLWVGGVGLIECLRFQEKYSDLLPLS
jgi:hypothetical protein